MILRASGLVYLLFGLFSLHLARGVLRFLDLRRLKLPLLLSWCSSVRFDNGFFLLEHLDSWLFVRNDLLSASLNPRSLLCLLLASSLD